MQCGEKIHSANYGDLTIVSTGQDPSGLTRAVATSDGGQAIRTGWCECTGLTAGGMDAYYEALNVEGQAVSHGWVCEKCRKLTQVG